MKKRGIFVCFVLVLSILTGCATARPPEKPLGTIDTILFAAEMAKKYDGKTICMPERTVMGEIDAALNDYVGYLPKKNNLPSNSLLIEPDILKKYSVSDKDIYLALANKFPCPFKPKLVQMFRASSSELIGQWSLVPDSLKIKTNLFEQDPFPSNCEYFLFSEGGDMRSLQLITKDACPSVTAKDFKVAKELPKVIDWKLGPDGMLKITRTDNPNYIELWETYIVTTSFSQSGVQFKTGDLLLFMAQFNQKKKEGIGTLYFRQFRKTTGS